MTRFKALLMVASGCASGLAQGQVAPMVMDGLFDDWAGVSGWTDPTGPEGTNDLLELKATHDEEYLYVYLRLGSDIDLTDNLFLHIDTDADAATGYPA